MPAKGDGITKRKDGRYVGRYTVHTADGPKRKVIYGRKYNEVKRKRDLAVGDAAKGIVYDAKGETVGTFLQRWLEDVVKPNKTHRTYATHHQQVLRACANRQVAYVTRSCVKAIKSLRELPSAKSCQPIGASLLVISFPLWDG
jgi:hypothetical protein